jgi:predicted RND superfamily exporter protein
MAISGNDGREELHSVMPSALASIVTFMPLKGFYALGATRIRLFDQIGVIMIIGGASIPIAHITLRVLTRRLRRRRH